jgi:hypothetical protein
MHFGSVNVGLGCPFKLHGVENRECLQRDNAFHCSFQGGAPSDLAKESMNTIDVSSSDI